MQRRVKSYAWMLLVVVLCFIMPQTGQAAAQPSLYLDGNTIVLPEPIKIVNSSVMIPIRVVSEELGYKVDWTQETRTVTINNGNDSITLVANKQLATVNGDSVKLDTPAMITNGTTFVPLRFVGEAMGLVVDWDNQTKTAYLFTSKDGGTVVPPTPGGNDPNSGNNGGGSTEGEVPPVTNDGNVVDFAFFDNTLHIAVDKDIQPKVSVMTNPDRIVVDIPGAVFSEEFKKKFVFDPSGGQGELAIAEYPDVQRVRYAMFSQSPNTVRFVIDANYALSYEQSLSEGLISLVLSADETKPPTKPTDPTAPGIPKDKYTVVIDAGHGDHDSGAVSIRKRYEKTANLQIALKVAELAKKESKLNIVLTRDTDVFLELSERVSIANKLNADLFVSIHNNSINNSSVYGTETYYYREDSKKLAQVMHKYLMAGTQSKDRGAKQANHHVTRNTKMPAVLLEVGFLTNSNEEANLFNESFQYRVAQQIVNGIKAYVGLS